MFDFDMADVRPSLMSFFVVGTMAVLYILLLKYAANRWSVPVLRDVINAV